MTTAKQHITQKFCIITESGQVIISYYMTSLIPYPFPAAIEKINHQQCYLSNIL